jgi:hypothetical protein
MQSSGWLVEKVQLSRAGSRLKVVNNENGGEGGQCLVVSQTGAIEFFSFFTSCYRVKSYFQLVGISYSHTDHSKI